MARKTPRVRDTLLIWHDEHTGQDVVALDIVRDWRRWLDWLDNEKSFRFIAADGTSCSVIKELRRHYGNRDDMRPVWYAHKRLGGKLRRRYLGKNENVSHERLKQVAFELSQRALV